jgi:hypothetical protein
MSKAYCVEGIAVKCSAPSGKSHTPISTYRELTLFLRLFSKQIADTYSR